MSAIQPDVQVWRNKAEALMTQVIVRWGFRQLMQHKSGKKCGNFRVWQYKSKSESDLHKWQRKTTWLGVVLQKEEESQGQWKVSKCFIEMWLELLPVQLRVQGAMSQSSYDSA